MEGFSREPIAPVFSELVIRKIPAIMEGTGTMTTKPIRVGGDFGNSQSTLAIPAGRGYRTLTIPSFLGRGSFGELQRMRRGGGHSAIPDEPAAHAAVVTVDGVEQFVGRLLTKHWFSPHLPQSPTSALQRLASRGVSCR